ncbi:MAG: bifunctional (p)ppGpp synthetase/guanosine-3',5'-bis(diphosphate) 3'-pyrophosphohydrolase [Clostridiales bacterium]|nr:bifunctional (p)ppGpp synthetase/guanosine-3',5'-bis(diphosphate) 3'-pyrophosphohydrolase [Clostridiales bacterium]
MDEVYQSYLDLEEKIREYDPDLNASRLRSAYEYARQMHGNQKRKDGSAYITHPIASAEITAEMGLDEDAIVACLLHDCIEDTKATYEDISKRFGSTVADIVEGVTKLTRVTYTSKEEEQVENLRKMLIAMAKDIRVILIKIADRLHNMRTMNYQSAEKQREKARETMEVYAPIAHRLGMQKIKWELEDLALIYLDPLGYSELSAKLEMRMKSLEGFMTSIQRKISSRMDEYGIKAAVFGRIKHIYSIYRKMYSQHRDFNEVFDICAFRVIVDDIADCYNVLGHIHDLFKPLPGKFKDYISTPKANNYQSIHTTVIGTEGIPFEVQIRTREMHHTAEYGIAAHWKYKEGLTSKTAGEEKFAWIRTLLETQQDTDAQDFVQALKIDLFGDEVFVFTPQGDVINLPAGATPIDFAYAIHSAVGNRMTGAKVNGKLVTIDTALSNGDVVEILTSGASKGPSRDWMSIAKSSEARGKIKQWFKKERREENIIHGKASFEAEMKRNNLRLSDPDMDDLLPVILKKLSFSSLDDMYAAIGYGGLTSVRAVNRVREELIRVKKQDREKIQTDKLASAAPAARSTRPIRGIMVEGLDNCLIKFSRCCTPVPGDSVVGFITRGYGVSVHRKTCQNYKNARARGEDEGRWINVSWGDTAGETYETSLKVLSRDRGGLVLDLATALSAAKVKINSLSARDLGNGNALAYVSVNVKDLEELSALISRLEVLSGVTSVLRSGAET